MSDKQTTSCKTADLISKLEEAVGSVDKDHLSVLAKMHGWCEALVGLTGPDGEQPSAEQCERARSTGSLLESVILGEAENPEEVIASIAKTIASLAGGDAGGGNAVAVDDEAPAGASSKSCSQVEADLANIFEEEPVAQEDSTSLPPEVTGQTEDVAQGDTGIAPETSRPSATAAGHSYESEPLKIDASEIEFVQAFTEEADEHLESIEAAVLGVEQAPEDTEKINDLFRPFHTIKGMAGFLNLRDIGSLTHEVETLIDQARKGDRKVTPGLIDLIFEVVDILKTQIGAITAYTQDPTGDEIPQPPISKMVTKLREVVAGGDEPQGVNPPAGGSGAKVGENLVEQRSVPKEVVDFALERQENDKPDKKTGEILVDMKAATPKQVSQAIRAQKEPSKEPPASSKSAGDQSVRIDTAKLDALVDMVGELVIAQTQVGADSSVLSEEKLNKNVNQVTKIVRDVQEVAMAMRMIPIGATFQKMARLVRDVSRKAGKKVDLVISGEETELDKNVIQQIGDPLVHMVRNAVDHGVESPEERAAAGKPEGGTVHLSAFHHGGNIVIEIRDDGKGLDRDKLIAKGIERGIVKPGEELTDEQAYGLVFAAGFSTATKVTAISGRGVGMDVVKRNIEQLRGRVDITSELGKGSVFSIRLPLTLAIIDGMIVRVGKERFIIQTVTLEQSLRPQPEQITTVQHRGEVLNVRGRLIPLIQLGSLFGLTDRVDPCEAMVVIAQYEGGPVGLVVEELLGQQQVVIKSLGKRFEKLRGISGAAILGDGKIGLIIELSGLVGAHHNHPTEIIRQKKNMDLGDGDSGTSDTRDETVAGKTADRNGVAGNDPAVEEPLLA